MLSIFKKPLFSRDKPASLADSHALRLAVYEQELGEREHTFLGSGDSRIDMHAFGRDFVPDCEEGSDEGYVLLSNGMSEQRMTVPEQAEAKPRAEFRDAGAAHVESRAIQSIWTWDLPSPGWPESISCAPRRLPDLSGKLLIPSDPRLTVAKQQQSRCSFDGNHYLDYTPA